jgi:hypothetical protein
MSTSMQQHLADFSYILGVGLTCAGAGAFYFLCVAATAGPFIPVVNIFFFSAGVVAALMLATGFALQALSAWIAPQLDVVQPQHEPLPADNFRSTMAAP